ncbi:MAG: copper amine oxidase N-terminal domain-containing protein [Syntrophomonas sp.]
MPTIVWEGKELSLETPPLIEGDSILVPMEAVFSQLGARVKWDEIYQTATIIKSGNGIISTVGKTSVWINGNNIPINTPSQIIDGTTMIPLSILHEGLGAKISWDETSEKIVIDAPLRDNGLLYDTTFEKVISAPYFQCATDVKQVKDGGFIIVGSNDLHPIEYNIAHQNSESAILLIKLGKKGDIEWKKTIGNSGNNTAQCVQCTEDNGFIIAGSIGGGDSPRAAAIIKFNASGVQEWTKTFEPCDELCYVSPTIDGGFILTGREYGEGIWIIKTDHSGKSEWAKIYRITPNDWAHSIFQTKDQGFILSGNTFGKEINSGCYPFVLKLDNKGSISWSKIYPDDISVWSLQPISDGGYVGAGECSRNAMIMRLDEKGSIVWKKAYGSSKDDAARCAIQTSDGGFIVAGETLSSPRLSSGYLLKLDKDGNLAWEQTIGTQIAQSFAAIQQTKDNGFLMVGKTSNDSSDVYVVKTDSHGNLYYR